MPTQRLYYDDAFLREFSAAALTSDQDPARLEMWRVKLDRTAFYPTSGGQPHDLGQLGDRHIVDVIDEGDEIAHIVDGPLSAGPVKGRIDWARRFDHMQQHTGQHLLSAIFHQKFCLPTVSFHLGADTCTIDLRGAEPLPVTLDEAARAANEIVYEDRPVTVKYGTAEELAAAGVRKNVERTGVLRAVEIAQLELQPCGGTHVRATGQIGTILIRGMSKIRQDWRIEFVCGQRAARLAQHDFVTLRRVAQRLNCAPAEAIATAERVIAERDAHFKSARAAMERLAAIDAQAAIDETGPEPGGMRIVSRLFNDVAPEYVQIFAREAANDEKTVALTVRAECGHVFFSQHPSAGKEMNTLLTEGLKTVGGKGGGTRDSARGKLADPDRGQELLDWAAAQLRAGN